MHIYYPCPTKSIFITTGFRKQTTKFHIYKYTPVVWVSLESTQPANYNDTIVISISLSSDRKKKTTLPTLGHVLYTAPDPYQVSRPDTMTHVYTDTDRILDSP